MRSKLLKISKYAAIFVISLLLLLVLSLQIDATRKLYLNSLTDTLKASGINLKIGRISGFFPINWQADKLEIADKQGQWLEIQDFKLDYSFIRLLSSSLQINNLSAGVIRVNRVPELPESEQENAEKPQTENQPSLPITIDLKKLRVNKILLAKQLLQGLSEPVDLEKEHFLSLNLAANSLVDLADKSNAKIKLSKIDYSQQSPKLNNTLQTTQNEATQTEIGSFLAVDLGFAMQNKQLSVKTDINIFQSLLSKLNGNLLTLPAQPEIGDIQLALSGDAPINDWQGKLKLAISKIANLDSDILIKNKDSLGFNLKNKLIVDNNLLQSYQLPPELADIKLNANITQDKNQKDNWLINQFSISSFIALLEANGLIDVANQANNLKATISLDDLSSLKALLPEQKDLDSLKGKLQLESAITGKWLSPVMDYTLSGGDIVFNNLKLPSVNSQGRAIITDNKGDQQIQLNTKGQLEKLLVLQQQHIPQLSFNWQGDLLVKDGQNIQINSFDVDSELFKMMVKGDFDTLNQSGKITLNNQLKDLSLISLADGEKLAGTNKLYAEAIIADQAKDIQLDIRSEFNNLGGLPAELAGLLGTTPDFNSKIRIYNQEYIVVDKLILNSKELQLDGSAKSSLSSGKINATINTIIANLESLSKSLPQHLAGNLEQSVVVSGTMEKPQLDIKLKGKQLVVNEYKLGELDVKAELSDAINKPQGNIDIDLAYNAQFLKLQSDFKLIDNIFTLSDLLFKAPKSKINGQLQFNLDNKLAIGKLKGQINDFSKLAFLHQQKNLTGDLNFDIVLDQNKLSKQQSYIDQKAEFTIKSKSFAMDDIALKKLDLKGNVSGLANEIIIDSKLDINKIIYGESEETQVVGNLSLLAKGNTDQINIKLNAATEKNNEFIKLSSSVKQKTDSLTVLLTQLDARIFDRPLKLLKQTEINLFDNNQHIKLAPMELSYDNSMLKLDADIDQSRDRINSNVNLSGFPLDILSQLNLQVSELSQIQGTTDLDLSISGGLKKPKIDLQTKVNQLSLKSQSDAKNIKIPLADVLLKSSYSNGLAKNLLNISGLTDKPIKADLQLPMGLSLLPFNFNLKQKTKLKGKLDAMIDLSKLQSWVELDQQVIEGILSTDLAISGSVEKPELLGDIVLKQGKYENAEAGTLLHDIKLNIKAEKQQLNITELSANDTELGMIDGKGKLQLDPATNNDYQFEVKMNEINLVRRDDLNMQLTGNIKLKGDKHKGELKSLINIDKGEFFLPDSTGADIPELDVVEINHQDNSNNNKEEKSSDSAYPLALDVSIVIPSKFYVRGRGLESEWKGNISVKQKVSDPLLEGSLEVKRGFFNFMRHRFNFRKGNINFVGSIPPQPQLDFEMAAEGKEVTAILKISGDAEKPDIELESEPMMPDDEILSRLLFNKDISEISGFEALQLANAVKTLATGGTGVMDKTRSSLGVDTIDVNGEDGSVKVGKHISEDVYVEVESGLSSGESEVKVEMEMTDHISIESRVDQKSNTGVGVNWKFDY